MCVFIFVRARERQLTKQSLVQRKGSLTALELWVVSLWVAV